MSFVIKCPNCKIRHSVSDDMAGTKAKCKCGTIISIPVPKPKSVSAEGIFVQCPACGQRHKAQPSMAGTPAKCSCGERTLPQQAYVAAGRPARSKQNNRKVLRWRPYAAIGGTIAGIVLLVVLIAFAVTSLWNGLFGVREVEYVWRNYASPGGGFSVDLPAGPPSIDKERSDLTVEQLRLPDGTMLDITHSQRLERDVQAELDRHVRGYTTIPGVRVTASERAMIGGLPGHAIKAEGRHRGRAYIEYFRIGVSDSRVYYVRWAHLKAHDADPRFLAAAAG